MTALLDNSQTDNELCVFIWLGGFLDQNIISTGWTNYCLETAVLSKNASLCKLNKPMQPENMHRWCTTDRTITTYRLLYKYQHLRCYSEQKKQGKSCESTFQHLFFCIANVNRIQRCWRKCLVFSSLFSDLFHRKKFTYCDMYNYSNSRV